MSVWVNRAGTEAHAPTTSTATRASVSLALREPTARTTSMSALRGELTSLCCCTKEPRSGSWQLEVSPTQKQVWTMRISLLPFVTKTCLWFMQGTVACFVQQISWKTAAFKVVFLRPLSCRRGEMIGCKQLTVVRNTKAAKTEAWPSLRKAGKRN